MVLSEGDRARGPLCSLGYHFPCAHRCFEQLRVHV